MGVHRRGSGCVVLWTALAFAVVVLGFTPVGAQEFGRVSQSRRGGSADGASGGAAASGDGSTIAFFSDAADLVSGDRNGVRDVFVRRGWQAPAERVSVNDDGGEANRASHASASRPAVNGSGAAIAFSSAASNLVPGDTNDAEDVFLSGPQGLRRLSVADGGAQANGRSLFPAISNDGCCVAFQSFASNLAAGDSNGTADIFVYDCRTQSLSLVSTTAAGTAAIGASATPAISGDCRFVAFASDAANLVAEDTNGVADIFVKDLLAGTVERISVASEGTQANKISYLPALNFDGSVAAFKSDATNLVPDDTNGAADVFVRDRGTGQTERVSVDEFGREANAFSGPPSLDCGGRFVAFPSWASNLVGDDGNFTGDVFVFDRETRTIGRILSADAAEPNGDPPDAAPGLSGDGQWVAFTSAASNLVPHDTNNEMDVFVAPNPRLACAQDDECGDCDACTSDLCDPDSGLCRHALAPDGTPCGDDLFCNGVETCREGGCTPSLNPCPPRCSACDEEAKTCRPTDGHCVIDGECHDAGAPNPANRCQECDPQRNATAWSNRPDGTVCSDGGFCVENDTCSDGVCLPGSEPCLEECSSCDEEHDRCVVDPGRCAIDGRCYSAGDRNPENPCEECDPSRSATAWSDRPDGSSYPGGQFCLGQVCRNGAPSDGAPPCAEECSSCDEESQSCTVTAGKCLIDGRCLDPGEADPDNPCRECRPQQGQTGWSNRADGTSCEDDRFCNGEETCVSGVCDAGEPPCEEEETCDEQARSCRAEDDHLHYDHGCAVSGSGGTGGPWLLLVPALGLLARRRQRVAGIALGALLLCANAAAAEEYPYLGLGLSRSHPVNDVYNAHVDEGIAADPFFGYMFTDFLGVETQLHVIYQDSHDHDRGFHNETQGTTMLGATVGPRLSQPLRNFVDLELFEPIEVYAVAQGGVFTGVSGHLNHTAPGFSLGGGADYRLNRNLSVGIASRWNRAYMSAHPTYLAPPPNQDPRNQGPEDIQWWNIGISVKYDLRREPEAAAVPPPPPPAPTPAAAVEPPVKRRFVLRSVHFDFDRSEIRPEDTPVLDEAVRVLMDEPNIVVVVEGHTDSRGSEEYNLALSERRIRAVRDYLIGHGITPNRLSTEAFGESKPVASNDTDDGRAQNRRVELRVE